MSKTIKRAFQSIALASTIIYGAIIAPELHNNYLRWEVGESVVQVLHPTLNGGGTGFAIKGASGKEYIMTNRHVCEVSVNEFVRIKVKDKEFKRKVIYRDNVHDLCLVQGIKGLAPLTIGSDQKEGEFMFVVGHPGLRKLTTSQGEYIGRVTIELQTDVQTRKDCLGRVVELPPLAQFFMQKEFICLMPYRSLGTTAVIYGGNSGSPVVNKYGNLIGVAFAGSTQEERNNFIVPLFYVKRVLKSF